MIMNFPILLVLLIFETLLVLVVLILFKSRKYRFSILFISFGLFCYSGIGAAFEGTAKTYLQYYIVFCIVLVLFYYLFVVALQPISLLINSSGIDITNGINETKSFRFIIPIFILIQLFPLIYPENKLFLLFKPPMPDLVRLMKDKFTNESVGIIEKTWDYIRLLIAPFFYIALYRYRKKPFTVFLLLIAILYLQYLKSAYIGRGQILAAFAIFALGMWFLYPGKRKRIIIWGLVSIIPIVMLAYIYQVIRGQGRLGDLSITNAFAGVFNIEFGFPRDVTTKIISNDYRENISAYLLWLFTLPVPKVLTGPLAVAHVNMDISQLILGIGPSSHGFFIVLPGIVGESIFIFGEQFFWLQACFIAFAAALLIRICECIKSFLFLEMYILVQLAYYMNRGGIGGSLPNLVNDFILLYLYLFYRIFNVKRFLFVTKRN